METPHCHGLQQEQVTTVRIMFCNYQQMTGGSQPRPSGLVAFTVDGDTFDPPLGHREYIYLGGPEEFPGLFALLRDEGQVVDLPDILPFPTLATLHYAALFSQVPRQVLAGAFLHRDSFPQEHRADIEAAFQRLGSGSQSS